jgi:hypothetical protein
MKSYVMANGSDFDQPDSSAVVGGGGRAGTQGGLGGFQSNDRNSQLSGDGGLISPSRRDRFQPVAPPPPPNLLEELIDFFGITPETFNIPGQIEKGFTSLKTNVEELFADPSGKIESIINRPETLMAMFGLGNPIGYAIAAGGSAGKAEHGRLADDFISQATGFDSVAEVEEAFQAGVINEQTRDDFINGATAQADAFMAQNTRNDIIEREATDVNTGGNDSSILVGNNRLPISSTPIDPALSIEELLAQITGNTVNPFGDTEEGLTEFNDVIQSGIGRLFAGLGTDPNQQLVDATFNRSNVGDIILGQERGIRQTGFNTSLNDIFTGDAFGDIDDSIINSIVDERAGGQRDIFAGQQARGNFSDAGVLAANEDLTSQIPGATSRVREVGQNVSQGSQGDINAIRDTAFQGISDFRLGDDAFDITPFATQRQDLIGERTGSFSSDITGALGGEPLFNINQSLLSGGRSQGVVSGAQPNTFLDELAARERRGTGIDQRGIGTRGSGAF